MEATVLLQFLNEISGTYSLTQNETVADEVIKNAEISGSRYENVLFENVEFDNCIFQSTEFVNVKFIDCKFKNCTFNFCKFKECNLIACKIESCSFCITNSLNCNFLSCTYIQNSWENSKHEGNFLNCNIESTEETQMEITMLHEIPPLSSKELQVAWFRDELSWGHGYGPHFKNKNFNNTLWKNPALHGCWPIKFLPHIPTF